METAGMEILAAAGEAEFFDLNAQRVGESIVRLSMPTPIFKHVVGRRPRHRPVLAHERSPLIRQCGGLFEPSCHIVVGKVIHTTPPAEGERRWYRLIADCGVPISLSSSLGGGSPHPTEEERCIRMDEWVAAMGPLWVSRCEADDVAAVRGAVIDASLLDMDPDSATFGSLVPCPPGQWPAVDSDVVPIRIAFIRLRVARMSGSD